MKNKKVPAATIARTVVLALALVNQLLSAAGKPVLPIDSASVEQWVTAGLTTAAANAGHGGRITPSPPRPSTPMSCWIRCRGRSSKVHSNSPGGPDGSSGPFSFACLDIRRIPHYPAHSDIFRLKLDRKDVQTMPDVKISNSPAPAGSNPPAAGDYPELKELTVSYANVWL